MIDLQKCLNLSEKINGYISERRQQQKTPQTSAEFQSLRILTQERDGCILFTWDDVSGSNEGAVVTHFGCFDPGKEKIEDNLSGCGVMSDVHGMLFTLMAASNGHCIWIHVLHIHTQREYVVSCSVNMQRTQMAFVTMKKEGSTDRRSGKELYTAFLSEIKVPYPRVFSLNLERYFFLKVQFLYLDTSTEKETYLLVMLHKESIGLYKMKLARADKGMVMRGQPYTEQICRKFVWCQWDCQTQQLFYIHYLRDAQDDKKSVQEDKKAFLTCVQFHNNAQHENVLDVSLTFPFTSKSNSRYADIPLHNGIPDTSTNVVVLTQGTGTFCICYQHIICSRDRSKSSPLPRNSPLQRTSPHSSAYQPSPTESDGDITDINYYVCMVHHAKTLHGCVSNIPANILKKAIINFSWFGDTILVLLPGYFIHLLNTGMEFEPCNHILLHNRTFVGADPSVECMTPDPTHPGSSVTQPPVDRESLVPALTLMAEHLQFYSNTSIISMGKDNTGPFLYERSSSCIYKVCLNSQSLLKTFTEAYMSMTRTALLHYVILRTRDFALLKKLFQVLCNDIPSAEVPSLMKEFLIAMTYASMKRQVDREVLRLLPFTNEDAFRGQLDKTADGERLAKVSYSPIKSVNILAKTARERQWRKGAEDMLDMLRDRLQLMQVKNLPRFSLQSIRKASMQINGDQLKLQQKKQEDMFLTMARSMGMHSPNDMVSHAVGSYGYKTDSILGTLPFFLQGTSVTDQSERLTALTQEVLTKHLNLYLHKDSKVKAPNVAKEYINCQMQQSRLLCHLLWSLRGSGLGQHDKPPNLLEKTSLAEYELFQLMERYSLSVQEVMFPIPQGFLTYLTSLTFRCLTIREFIQYVERGAVHLTGDFMVQMLSDLPDQDTLKKYIISKLPQTCAEECYRQWGHVTCKTYLAHQQTGRMLQKLESIQNPESDMRRRRSTIIRDSRDSELEGVTFQPLAAFLRHLQTSERQKTPGEDAQHEVDLYSLADVAMYHTTHETKYNMSTVNF